MSVAAYTVSLKRSGKGVASTGETMSLVSGRTYQIASTAKRVWDRNVVPVLYSSTGAGALTLSSTARVNYLFGKVVLAATYSGTITADVTYLPMSNVAGAHTFNLQLQADVLDDTDFSSTGWRSKQMGLKDAALSVSRWETMDLRFWDALTKTTGSSLGSTTVVAEVVTAVGGPVFRGYYRVEAETRSGAVSDLEQAELSLALDSSTAAFIAWSDIDV